MQFSIFGMSTATFLMKTTYSTSNAVANQANPKFTFDATNFLGSDGAWVFADGSPFIWTMKFHQFTFGNVPATSAQQQQSVMQQSVMRRIFEKDDSGGYRYIPDIKRYTWIHVQSSEGTRFYPQYKLVKGKSPVLKKHFEGVFSVVCLVLLFIHKM